MSLPTDMIAEICEKMSVEDLGRMVQVSKQFNFIGNPILEKKLRDPEFGRPDVIFDRLSLKFFEKYGREIYYEVLPLEEVPDNFHIMAVNCSNYTEDGFYRHTMEGLENFYPSFDLFSQDGKLYLEIEIQINLCYEDVNFFKGDLIAPDLIKYENVIIESGNKESELIFDLIQVHLKRIPSFKRLKLTKF